MNQERDDPRELQVFAAHLKQTSDDNVWVEVAELARQGFEGQLTLQRKMIQVRPRARHYMSIAELTNQLVVTKELLAGETDAPGLVGEQEALLRESIAALEAALLAACGGGEYHNGHCLRRQRELWLPHLPLLCPIVAPAASSANTSG